MGTYRFDGSITGLGTTSGLRLVVGAWHTSPLGRFCDVMISEPTGHRVLLAPDRRIADFVSATYRFDEVVIEPINARLGPDRLQLRSTSLTIDAAIGGRQPLGVLLSLIPPVIAHAEGWNRLISPLAAILQPGVRTHGSAGSGRTEWYAARDLRTVTALSARWRGADCGALTDLDPPVRFGFSSTPRRPAQVRVSSFVRDP